MHLCQPRESFKNTHMFVKTLFFQRQTHKDRSCTIPDHSLYVRWCS